MAPIARKKYCRVLYTENIESIQSTSRGIGIKFCALFHEINFVLPSFHMWCHSSWNIWADFLAQAGQRLKILGTCVRKAWEWGYLDRSISNCAKAMYSSWMQWYISAITSCDQYVFCYFAVTAALLLNLWYVCSCNNNYWPLLLLSKTFLNLGIWPYSHMWCIIFFIWR